MSPYLKIGAAAAALVTACAGAIAYATPGYEGQDAPPLPAPTVALRDAVRTAEAHTQGRATGTRYAADRHGPFYEVEVVAGERVLEVRVNATDGKVRSAVLDRIDEDGDEGEGE